MVPRGCGPGGGMVSGGIVLEGYGPGEMTLLPCEQTNV